MFGILQAQAPAKQTATDTISTLSSRLSSATLLEDRRAAILGLRSFAKGYPASVASGALRGLIGSLSKDIEDVDTVKVVLETLLTLFSPDEASPEASDDIALWLADEFTQRQDNITTLLDLLDTAEFYSRLYSLQLLSAILSARPDRTQECVFTAPLGISRLVAVLDDKREAIRNEGLLLLTSLTPSSSELQKLVAFENAFERVFSLIIAEGSLTHGGIIIQDCLSLLANLLRLNVSNQSFFRETGCVPKIARLIAEAVKDQDTIDGVAEWAKPQRDKNLWGVLALLRLFLVQGGLGTQANQLAFWQSGIAVQVLKLAFSRSTEVVVKAEALTTCADLIRGNPKLQVEFAQQNVDSHSHEPTAQLNGAPQQNGINKVNVIHGLLELVLTVNSLQAFDIRLAACECVKSYIYRHGPIRLYFLGRAIDGHTSGNDETPNILTTLLEPSDALRKTDPYKIWLASVLFLHLVFEEPEAKAIAMGVTEGDASKGEEVVTCIQALTGNLIACLQRGEDQRLSVGYLMVLCGWLFEDPDAVNDFLGEGSSVQSLVQATVQGGPESTIVRGLCAVLLGIVYEFSTKDSPIPRATLHSVLSTSLGREQYMDKITRLREHPILRDFEVLHQGLDSNQLTGLPDVYFDKTFVDFLKDNFSRLIRAVDRDPGMEVPVVANGIQKGISRELVDSLRAQVDEKNQALQKAEGETLTLERKLGQEQADHRRTKETSTVDLNRLRAINDSLQKNHESEISQLQERNRIALKNLQQEKDREIQALQMQIQQVQQEADQQALRTRERIDAEVNDLKGTIRKHEQQLERASAEHLQDLQTAHEEYTAKLNEQETRAKRAEEKCTDADARAKRSTDAIKEAEGKATKAEEEARTKEAARSSTQAELDDLLMVLGDLEEKRTTDKKRLKELGESISDEEDGEEDEEDGEDEDEEEDEVPEANTKSSDHDDDVD
ncbi:MAG: 5'-3' exoribonuclease 2 [Chaenotheca gracillima]|nr:MAG: 5'-3' exoribonuclease 2 [Chaenotheca gracillima]